MGDANALVTGAAGFIGRHLVARLRAGGYRVTALLQEAEAVPAGWSGHVGIVRGNIAERKTVYEAMRGHDLVFHLAAIVDDWAPRAAVEAVNVEGSRHVFEEASRLRARTVLASSIVVYGDRLAHGRCDEESGFGRCMGNYSASKQAQERLAMECLRDHGLPVVILRPGNVYGAGSRPWVYRVIDILRRRKPVLVGDGAGNAGLVHVENVVEMLMLAAQTPLASGRIYNVVDPWPVSWRRYFSDLARLAGTPPPRSIGPRTARLGAGLAEMLWRFANLDSRPPLTREALNLIGSDVRIDSSRASRELGYQPCVDYEQGLIGLDEFLDSPAAGALRG